VTTQKLGGNKMTVKRLAQFMLIIMFLLCSIPALAGEVVFYDKNGKMIDETKYEKIVKERSQEIEKIMQKGFDDGATKLEDPILLRKKRLEQWRKYRESLRKMKT
jgi:hypothetical protein